MLVFLQLMQKEVKLRRIKNPIYLNANLIYSEALNAIQKEHWKRDIKAGTLHKLRAEGYNLVTSILTRMEVIQRLNLEESTSFEQARHLYQDIIQKHGVVEITNIHNHIPLTDAFIDEIASSRLDFKDALHLAIAKKLSIPLCTHDKKMKEPFPQHQNKSKFYELVYKPEELIKPRT